MIFTVVAMLIIVLMMPPSYAVIGHADTSHIAAYMPISSAAGFAFAVFDATPLRHAFTCFR